MGEAGAVGLAKQLAEEVTCQPLEDGCQQQVVEPDRIWSKVDRIVSGKARCLPFRPHNGNPNYSAVEQEDKGSCIRAICVEGVAHILEKTWCFCLSEEKYCIIFNNFNQPVLQETEFQEDGCKRQTRPAHPGEGKPCGPDTAPLLVPGSASDRRV